VGLDARLEALRALGLSESQVIDLVNQELMHLAATRRDKDTVASTTSNVPVGSSGEITSIAHSAEAPLAPLGRTVSEPGENVSVAPVQPIRKSDDGSLIVEIEPQVITVPFDQGERSYSEFSSFTGPMPPPNVARAYEKLCPGFTERNLAMLERESGVALASIEAEDGRLARGQRFALYCAFGMIGVALVMVVMGHPITAAVVIGAEMVALVSAFLYRNHQRHDVKQDSLPPTGG